MIDEVQFTEPMDVRYDESFVVKKDLFEKSAKILMRLIASCAWDGEFQNWNATTNR